jgi:hypothetical protein
VNSAHAFRPGYRFRDLVVLSVADDGASFCASVAYPLGIDLIGEGASWNAAAQDLADVMVASLEALSSRRGSLARPLAEELRALEARQL